MPQLKTKHLLYIILLLMVSACGSKATTTPTATPLPSATATATPLPTPTPMPTTTPLPLNLQITPDASLVEKIEDFKTRNPALGSLLNELIVKYEQEGQDATIAWMRERQIIDAQDNIPLTVILDTEDEAVIQALSAKAEAYGCTVLGYLGNELEVLIPLALLQELQTPEAQQTLLDELANLEHVRNVKLTTFMAP